MKTLVVLSLLLVGLISGPAAASEITGPARVIDGDTLDVGGHRIRLFGIDAPEMHQNCQQKDRSIACGERAKLVLETRIAGQSVTCIPRDTDHYGRTVAVCYANDGRDLSDFLAAQGWAMAYRAYSQDYVASEEDAHRARRGMWRFKFQAPWLWRREHRR